MVTSDVRHVTAAGRGCGRPAGLSGGRGRQQAKSRASGAGRKSIDQNALAQLHHSPHCRMTDTNVDCI